MLPNGKVLVAGGFDNSGFLTSAELYDPASGTWTCHGQPQHRTRYHTATLLPNGKVLVAGGISNSGALTSAELYDPASGSWTATGSLNTARVIHTATLLPNGKVLVAGGDNNSGDLTSAELYELGERELDCHGQPQYRARATHGDVAAQRQGAGGRGYEVNSDSLTSAELYDPASGSWTATGSLNTARDITRRRCCPTARCWWQGDKL